MNEIANKVIDNLFPVGGGATGGFIAWQKHLLWMRVDQWAEAVITIALGAVLGYFIKKGLDWCLKKCNQNCKHE